MQDCNVVKNPIVTGIKPFINDVAPKVDATQFKQVVGSLMYFTTTRSNLMFGV